MRRLTCLPSPSPHQALTLDPSSPYNIHFPVRRGRMNIHPGPGGSLTAVVADLRTIWLHCIERLLGIPRADLEVRECTMTASGVGGGVGWGGDMVSALVFLISLYAHRQC